MDFFYLQMDFFCFDMVFTGVHTDCFSLFFEEIFQEKGRA